MNAFNNEEPQRISPINSNTVLGEEEKIVTSEAVENHEIVEKKEDAIGIGTGKNEKNANEEKKEEADKNDELLVFNLKYVKTSLLTNIQVKIKVCVKFLLV